MAEHDWYEKHKKEVAAALKKGKGAAKEDGVPCTLVKMKDGSALLCAGVSSSKAAALVKEAKGAGGKVLSTGTLFKGDGGPTFAVSDGSTSCKALFSAAAAEAAGAPLNVIVVAVTPPGETASAPPPPPPPPPGVPPPPPPGTSPPPTGDGEKTRFTDLLRQVRPRFQQAIAADPPNKANLEKGMGMAVAAAKENDFSKGLKVLQALDVALQKTPLSTGSVPPPPPPTKTAPTPPPPPPISSPPPSVTAPIQAALAKMLPLVKSAAAANPDRKTELLEPLKRCQDHLKNNQAIEAKAALFDLNRVLKELNGAVPPPPPLPTGKAPPKVDETEGKEEEHEEAESKEGVTAPESKEEAGDQEEEEEEEKSGTAPTTPPPPPPPPTGKAPQKGDETEGKEEEHEEVEAKEGVTPPESKEETGEQKEEEEEEEAGTPPTTVPPPPPPPTGKAPTKEEDAEGKEEEHEESEAKEGVTAPESKEQTGEQKEEEEEEEAGTPPTTVPPPPPPPTGKAPTKEEEAEGKEEEHEEEEKEGVTAPESKEETGEQKEEEEEEEEKSGTTPTTEEAAEEEEATTTVGVWVDARDKVITQMQALQAACGKECQETGDPDFDLIADKGLAAITKRLQVGLHVALMEFDRASGDAKAKAQAKAQKVVTDFQTFLGSDRMVKLAEENPWGVKVEIRSTVGAALDRISKTLGA